MEKIFLTTFGINIFEFNLRCEGGSCDDGSGCHPVEDQSALSHV